MQSTEPTRQPTTDASRSEAPRSDRAELGARRGTQLPLQTRVEWTNPGWLIRLAVRAEEVTVEKQQVVTEEVVVRARVVDDTVRLMETARREQLRIDTTGHVAAVPADYPAAENRRDIPGAR